MKLPLKVDPFFAAGNRIGIQDADGRFIGEGNPGSSFRTFSMEEATELVDLVNEALRLRAVCAEAYQLAGVINAPTKVLDNLSAAANGEPLPHESFLPFALPETTSLDAEFAACNDMLSDARIELDTLRIALGVDYEPHQSVFERMLDEIRRLRNEAPEHCMCEECKDGHIHASDCSVHNGPAMPKGSCDCGKIDSERKF